MITCSSILNLRIRENQFEARENQTFLLYRSNWLLWKKSLPVVPIDIAENLGVPLIAEIAVVFHVSHYNIKTV